ncbi:MAG: ATP-binding cassette domain-containing protein [Leucobacter sp.]
MPDTIPSAPETPLLRVRNLTRRFGGVVALDDVSFDVAPGERLAIIGPNGAGKSTLLRLIAGQDRPTFGTVTLDDAPVSGRSPRHITRSGISLARQVPRPLGSLTVSENVAVGISAAAGRAEGRPQQRITEILESTGLSAKADRPAGSLPLLDLKRLEVARALASAPRLILLDEVSAGLGESDLAEVIELIRGIGAQGTALVFVEHVQEVVKQLAERVIVLNWGRHFAEGTPESISGDAAVREVYFGTRDPEGTIDPTTHRERPELLPGHGLVLRDIVVRRGQHLALNGATLEVPTGSITAVLGPNGAGKTTLSQSISGLLPVSGGELEFDGRDMRRVPAHARAAAGIAHCQEGRKLFPGLTVEENLMLGAFGKRRIDRQNLAELVLADFPVLHERRDQIATTMSGGQQQMLAIARALMSEPSLLILDELTLGLSPKAADEIYDVLTRIAERGTSLLLLEQNAERATKLADHVYVLSHGKVVFSGAPAELSQEDLVAAYLG